MRIAVFYIWVPGERFKAHTLAFARSYRKHPAGAEHDLIVLYKSDRLGRTLPALPVTKAIAVGEGGYDLGPFLAQAPRYAEHDRLVLLGAYSRLLSDGWLAKLTGAGELASATGSHEIRPHLRTNCLSVSPRLLEAFTPPSSKEECWAIEHGTDSLYERAKAAGVHGVVAGREGVFSERDWAASGTYRSGEQENLICSDNHTDAYASASAKAREKLRRDTWGEPELGPAPITVLTVTIPGREHSLARNVASVNAQTVAVARQLCLSHRGGSAKAMIDYSAAKNDLLQTVATEWVAVLNDDDTWLAHHVQALFAELDRADVLYSWDAGRTRPRENCNSWTQTQLIARLERSNFLDGNCLIRTRTLRDAGGFPTDLRGGRYGSGPANYEDWELWRRLARNGARFRCVPEETWTYSTMTDGRLSQ